MGQTSCGLCKDLIVPAIYTRRKVNVSRGTMGLESGNEVSQDQTVAIQARLGEGNAFCNNIVQYHFSKNGENPFNDNKTKPQGSLRT